MRTRRSVVLAVVVAGVAASLAVASVTPADSPTTCAPKGSKILKERGGVQVFIPPPSAVGADGKPWDGGGYVACSTTGSAWYPLPKDYDSDDEMGPIQIAGELVAFGFSASCGSCDGYESTLGVLNAATGARPYYRSTSEDWGEGWFWLTDLVLKPNGSFAFIADGNWRSKHLITRSVVRRDCNGTRILQETKRVGKTSLRLTSNATIRWRVGKREQSAGIC